MTDSTRYLALAYIHGTLLPSITVAAGYSTEAARIDATIVHDPSKVGLGDLPFFGAGPDPRREPQPQELLDRQTLEELYWVVQGIVAGQPGLPRQQAVSNAADDVINAVIDDPTLGGTVMDTIRISGPHADDVRPDLKEDGGRGTFLLVFRSRFMVDRSA